MSMEDLRRLKYRVGEELAKHGMVLYRFSVDPALVDKDVDLASFMVMITPYALLDPDKRTEQLSFDEKFFDILSDMKVVERPIDNSDSDDSLKKWML